ncbi:hypothetical protein P186_1406 [Pyrobaculum ferrireducens]|uniref:Uncharacterized protein n=2 Tax=Pyrobaculum ferrireducens TaxID=1104324 RepID=G7VE60_9CREN|nr:hypothetical protein P186_1406 [Pyrobaculum ferrireducens]
MNMYSMGPYAEIGRYIDDLLAGNPSIVGVPGVPGAGKTTFYAYTMANYLRDIICGGGRLKTLYVYLAPTNDLLIDFLEKFLGFLRGAFQVDCSPEELARRIRVYGSKIEADKYPQVFKAVDDDVLLVISTEWQRVSARVLSPRNQVYLIDEASRLTMSHFFIPIADGIAKGRQDEDILGFAVIGDVNQAVGLSEGERQLLLLEHVKRLSKGSGRVHLVDLNISWRLPRGTEEPIKEGYYDGNLEAKGNPFLLKAPHEELKRILSDEHCRRYEKVINEFIVLASRYPHVHIELDTHFVQGERYDERRARLAWCLARVISALSKKRVSVVVPYNQMAFAVRMLGRLENVHTATVASYLGREDDIIISVFGKEQVGGCNTYYLQDPYIPNVQHSRQKNALYSIGSSEILLSSVDACKKQLGGSPNKRYSEDVYEGLEKLHKMIEELQRLEKRVVRARGL